MARRMKPLPVRAPNPVLLLIGLQLMSIWKSTPFSERSECQSPPSLLYLNTESVLHSFHLIMSISLGSTSQYESWPASLPKASLYTMASLRATENCQEDARKAVDIVVVLDRSSSMKGEKLNLCLQTVEFLMKELTPKDRLSLVSYDSNVKTHFHLTNMDNGGKSRVRSQLKGIVAGTTTNLSGGLFTGMQELQRNSSAANDVQSILLLTDGLANVGVRRTDAIVNILGNALGPIPRASVFTFGYGNDHSESMLREISDKGRGVYYFVNNVDQIHTAFADCLGGLLSVVAQSIRLTCEVVGEGAHLLRVHSQFPTTVLERGRKVEISVGDMYAEEDRDILVEVSIPAVVVDTTISEAEGQGVGSDNSGGGKNQPKRQPPPPALVVGMADEIDYMGFVDVGKVFESSRSPTSSTASTVPMFDAFSSTTTTAPIPPVPPPPPEEGAPPSLDMVPVVRFTLEYVDVLAGDMGRGQCILRVKRPKEVAAGFEEKVGATGGPGGGLRSAATNARGNQGLPFEAEYHHAATRAVTRQMNRVALARALDESRRLAAAATTATTTTTATPPAASPGGASSRYPSTRGGSAAAAEIVGLGKARAVLVGAEEEIRANLEACGLGREEDDQQGDQDLLEELQCTMKMVETPSEYSSKGKYVMSNRAQTHWTQRCNESSAAPNPRREWYRKKKKTNMIERFRCAVINKG